MASQARSEDTKNKLIDAAMTLFAEQGIQSATMRAVAQQAGVSTGNAYYYFRSKDDLVQGYYARIVDQFAEQMVEALADPAGFEDRLRIFLEAWVDFLEPHRAFASDLVGTALRPGHPLSPFSEASRATRERAIGVTAQLVEGSQRLRTSDGLRAQLPYLVWLLELGTLMFWLHDTSAGAARTRLLVQRSIPIIVRLISVSRLPILRGTVDDLLDLMQRLGAR